MKDKIIFTTAMLLMSMIVFAVHYALAYNGHPDSLWLMQLIGVM